jgi:hypothetical protein
MIKKLLFAAALFAPAPAMAETDYSATIKAAKTTEYIYLGLSAADLVQTLSFDSDTVETHPFYRKNPRPARIIAAKLAGGAIHYTAFRLALKENPRFALRMAQVSVVVQGGIVGMNLRLALK